MKVFVSGITGSWGHEIVKQLLNKNHEVVGYSRNEGTQVEMGRDFGCGLKLIIGDIRDDVALEKAMKGCDTVFHAAALKHVPICEYQAEEAMKTNVIGTRNMIQAAIRNGVKQFVDISTDKVVDPANFYGLTKAMAEKFTIEANTETVDTDFIVTRTGNVLGSNGSVVPAMIDSIKRKNKIQITDERMVRFFLTLPQAVELLFFALENGKGGEIFVRDIPAFYISDLAELIAKKYGNKETMIEFTGMREGEKLDEALISVTEAGRTRIHKDYFVILPQIKTGRFYDYSECYLEKLTSDDRISTKEKLRELLISGGLI